MIQDVRAASIQVQVCFFEKSKIGHIKGSISDAPYALQLQYCIQYEAYYMLHMV